MDALWYSSSMKMIGFTILIFKENGAFVSFCPELSVASCGDSVEVARTRLKEAVRLFLEESARLGTLKTILEEEGFIARDASGTEWSGPVTSQPRSRSLRGSVEKSK